MSAIPAPEGLRAPGQKLWADIAGGTYTLRPDELRVLEDCCFEVDLIDQMRSDLASDLAQSAGSFMARGSTGQDIVHPLVGELRQHRALVQRLLTGLKLPDSAGTVAVDPGEARSAQARQAANARWKNG